MGLPLRQEPDIEQKYSQARAQSSESSGASQLPPEALDLASKLFDFAREGKTAELNQYITAGIPVNLTNHKGDTLLMLASYHGHLDTVEMLLQKGADANVLNERGQSPVAGAVFKGYDDIVKKMVEAGADIHAGQPNAVDSARMFRREECLRLFGVQEGQ
ncbi:hypothetical protein BAUCODRAFT_36379 [Baudoinia panamericana UAMH 10762]|uniref:Uncharacterized protein n=1 Tax=Baudoinia panamericana (strain UAMH 10762) TaxID=717646 RepID=M2MR28_BAUPA|nr:uncharacterized protein BAUCODRAFT_36379 [Baudoinia panamericana UAMH 10762]EMC93923.1 hypothetical protein BAUCODRAFT_36379 [Baudoinia panamericana UAMH 10762]